MSVKDDLATSFASLVSQTGKPVLFRYYTQTIGSVWDDDTTLTKSGNDLWTSGIILPLDTRQGSFDSVLVEQGNLIDNDIRLFVHGSLLFTGSGYQVTIGMNGSPTTDIYSIIPKGVIQAEIESTAIYKKAYLRKLPIGSLIG